MDFVDRQHLARRIVFLRPTQGGLTVGFHGLCAALIGHDYSARHGKCPLHVSIRTNRIWTGSELTTLA
jgi:hypothetical protein